MNQKAFTLIELLVVISIIGVIASIVLVSFSGSRDKAKLAKSQQFSANINHSLGAYAVGIWDFEDQNDPTIDRSGFGNDGTLYGNTHFVANDVLGGHALSFDGSGDYVDCQNGNFFSSIFNNSTDNFTISAWVKSFSLSSDGIIVGQRYGDSMVFGHRTSGNLFLNMDDTREGSPQSSIPIEMNKWQFVVVIFTGSDHMAYFYVNGESAGSGVAYDGNGIDTQNLLFIGYESRYSMHFHGEIDEVRIYNEALSTAQIQQHYALGAAKHGITLK